MNQQDLESLLQPIVNNATSRHTKEAVKDVLEAHRKLSELVSVVSEYDGTGDTEKVFIEAYNRFRFKSGGSL